MHVPGLGDGMAAVKVAAMQSIKHFAALIPGADGQVVGQAGGCVIQPCARTAWAPLHSRHKC